MVEEITVTVKVAKTCIRMLKIRSGGTYQLVCGGRLVSETRDGKVTPHRDLPQYEPSMFPGDWELWRSAHADARVRDPGVTVEILRDGRFVACDSPRTGEYLFGVHPKEDVVAWIREAAK